MMDRSAELKSQFQKIQNRILAACHTSARDPKEIKLVWVSKTRPLSDVLAATEIGATHFGENRIQEAIDKFTTPIPKTELHIIGPVQSNKLRKAVTLAQWIHSVDRIDQLVRLDRLAAEQGKKINVLFQVNTSSEESKSGIQIQDAQFFLKELPPCPHVCFRGLMTIGPNSGNAEDARTGFIFLRELLEKFCGTSPEFSDFRELSMGMSDDLEIAIAEGATMLRIGSALFGNRV